MSRRSRNYNGLTEREIEVLVCRYFLNMTLEAVGCAMTNQNNGDGPITRERVRQIEAAALRKIRRKPEEIW